MRQLGTVVEIWRYPVSSVGGEPLNHATLRDTGLEGDRLWGVVDREDGEIAAPEKRRKWRPLPNLRSRLRDGEIEISDDERQWLKVGSAEADALASRFLDFDVALRPHIAHGAAGHVAPRYQRADIHLVTTASMRRLASLLPNPAEVASRRFRPNVVIETADDLDGFVEHAWVGQSISIGPVRVEISEPCARCAFTALAQGELAFEPAVLQTIARHGEGGFGVLCRALATGEIRLGDSVAFA